MKRFLPLIVLIFSCQTTKKPDDGMGEKIIPPIHQPTTSGQHVNKRLLEIKVDPEKTLGMKGVELWYSEDGRTWLNYGLTEGKPSSIPFMTPKDGKFNFVIVPVDKAGERQFTPKGGTQPEYVVVIDTAQPVVEVKSPNGGETLGAGQSTQIQWVADDKNIAPDSIQIEISQSGGEGWITLVKNYPNTGRFFWDIPRSSSQKYKIRIKAQDLAGNVGSDTSDGHFTVDGYAPESELTGSVIYKALPAKIEFKSSDIGGAGIDKVRLYLTRDNGSTWQMYKETHDLATPINLHDLDGKYGLYLVAVDKVGNMNQPPSPGSKPHRTITIDTTAPVLKLSSPKHDIFMGNGVIDISWIARDNIELVSNSLKIEYTSDGYTWNPIVKDHEVATQNYKWKLPSIGGKDYKLKLTVRDLAGNFTEVHYGPFTVDTQVPEAIAGGSNAANTQSVNIPYEIKNKGYSDITKVTLYYTSDGGKTWFEYGDDPDLKSPFTFTKGDGAWGIYITCQTDPGQRSGIKQKAPESGVVPQLTITVDATAPTVRFTSFLGGGYYKVRSVQKIEWVYEDRNPMEDGLILEYSPDGGKNWYALSSNLNPLKKEYQWETPSKKEGEAYLLRLTARDKLGNSNQAMIQRPFKLDDELPTLRIVDKIEKSIRSKELKLGYIAKDVTSGIQRVIAYIKRMDKQGQYEKSADEGFITGEIIVKFPVDGKWGIKLVAVDNVGFESRDILKDPPPDVELRVDTKKPNVELKSTITRDGQKVFVNKNFELEWAASDEGSHSSELSIKIQYSYDGGRTWTVAVEKAPNTGMCPFENWLVPAKKIQIRLFAKDEAGNEGEAASGEFDVDHLSRPVISIIGIKEEQDIQIGTEISLKVTADSAVKNLQLEIKEPSEGWKQVGVRSDDDQFRFKVPEKTGKYLLRAGGKDSIGRTVYSAAITFSVRLPELPFVDIQFFPTRVEQPTGEEVTFTLVSREELKDAWLQVKISHDQWQNVQMFLQKQLRYKLPTKEGEYYFRISAKDKYDRTVISLKEAFIKVVFGGVRRIKMIPVGFRDGDKLQSKNSALIYWAPQEEWEYISEMWLQAFDGKSWNNVERVKSAEVRFTVPEKEGAYIFRLWGKDKKGGEFTSEDKIKVTVVMPSIQLKLTLDKNSFDSEEEVIVTIADKPPVFDPNKSSVEVTKLYREMWQKIESTISASSLKFKAPKEAGLYSVRLKYQMENNWFYSETLKIEVRSKAASLKLLNFKGNELIKGDRGIVIFIETKEIDMSFIKVELSDKSGADGTFKEIPHDQLTAIRNGIYWKIPPMTGKTFRLKISFGSQYDVSSSDFAIDSTTPVIMATGPRVPQEKTPIVIEYDEKQSISKITDIMLYITEDGGKTWRLDNIFAAGRKVNFSPIKHGEYGIFLAAKSEVLLQSEMPKENTKPQLTIKYAHTGTIKPPDLKIELNVETKAKTKGGDKIKASWKGTPDKAVVTIYVFVDDKLHTTLKENLKPVHAEDFTLPAIDGKKVQIRAKIELDGFSMWASSLYFEIDSKPPQIIEEEILPGD